MQNEFEKIKLPIIPLSNKIPVFLKPRKGSASKNAHIIKNEKNLRYYLSKNIKNKFIMQKYINGIEYTVDAYISKNGRFIGAVPRIRKKVTDGESTQTTTVKNKKILNLTKKIVNNFKFRGPICLQFIETKNKIYFLEINTRFGGGVIASIESGFNIPQIMIKDYLDYNLKELVNYKKITMTRFYKETFSKSYS